MDGGGCVLGVMLWLMGGGGGGGTAGVFGCGTKEGPAIVGGPAVSAVTPSLCLTDKMRQGLAHAKGGNRNSEQKKEKSAMPCINEVQCGKPRSGITLDRVQALIGSSATRQRDIYNQAAVPHESMDQDHATHMTHGLPATSRAPGPTPIAPQPNPTTRLAHRPQRGCDV